MFAELIVMPDAETPVIAGGVVSAPPVVVNVKSPDTAVLKAASLDLTR
jgi:hypothetical protein